MNLKNFLKESAVDLAVRAGQSREARSKRLSELEKQKADMAVKGFVPDPEGSPTKLGSSFRRAFFYDPNMDKAPDYTVAEWHESEQEKRKTKGELAGIRLERKYIGISDDKKIAAQALENKLDRSHALNVIRNEHKNHVSLEELRQRFDGRHDHLHKALEDLKITDLQKESRWKEEQRSLERLLMNTEKAYLAKYPFWKQEIEHQLEKAKAKEAEARTKYQTESAKLLEVKIKAGNAEYEEWKNNAVHREYLRYIKERSAFSQAQLEEAKLFEERFKEVEVVDAQGVRHGYAVNKSNPEESYLMYSYHDIRDEKDIDNATMQYFVNLRAAMAKGGEWDAEDLKELSPNYSEGGEGVSDYEAPDNTTSRVRGVNLNTYLGPDAFRLTERGRNVDQRPSSDIRDWRSSTPQGQGINLIPPALRFTSSRQSQNNVPINENENR